MDRNERRRRRYAARREFAFKYLGGKCNAEGCDKTEGLDIDHIDPSKKTFEFCCMAEVSRKRLIEELKNAQLLCRSHHNIKTYRDKGEEEPPSVPDDCCISDEEWEEMMSWRK